MLAIVLRLARRLLVYCTACVGVLFMLGADGCPDRQAASALARLLALLPETAWGAIDPFAQAKLRIHLYPEIIPQGATVESFIPEHETGGPRPVACESARGCLLFFVDTDHYAHFEHRTVIALWNLEDRRFHPPIVANWWPLLNGEPVFDKVRKREDWDDPSDPDPMHTIVFPPRLMLAAKPGIDKMGPVKIAVDLPEPPGLVLFSPPGPGAASACSTWAVIVNGFADPDDTFHIDTAGIYNVLRGHDIPTNQIHYLCPAPATNSACKILASKSNLGKVLTVDMGSSIPASAVLADSKCQELLFFYSAHGTSNGMWCGSNQPTFDEMSEWLDKVRCANITLVFEGCNSGMLISKLGTPPSGQTRFIFTSTDQGTKSYRDIDEISGTPDKNPGDIGSETIWGYVEAFGVGAADENSDQKISFNEATKYAEDFDITKSYGNVPKKQLIGTPGPKVHTCALGGGNQQLEMQLQQLPPDSPAQMGQILRCRCNRLTATISLPTGAAADPPPVASARFYWTDSPWTETDEPTWHVGAQSDFKQLLNSTRLLPSIGYPHTISLGWEVGKSFVAGTTVTLLAIVDSPDNPISAGPIQLSNLIQDPRAAALKLELVNPSSCFLFPCKGGSPACN